MVATRTALEDGQDLGRPWTRPQKKAGAPNEKRTPQEASLTGHRWEKLQVCLIAHRTLLIVSDTPGLTPFPASQRLRKEEKLYNLFFLLLPAPAPPSPAPCQHSP